jgi:hypothetical protein
MVVPSNLPEISLSTPEDAYSDFKDFVSQFDPIELLSQLVLTCLFTQKEFLGEATDERRWARLIEFTCGYLVSLPKPQNPKQKFDGSRIEEFESLVKRYFDSFMGTFLTAPIASQERPSSDALLRSAQIYSLWVRGDAYPHQFFAYAQELYGQHDAWFVSHLGFTIADAIAIIHSVTAELNRRVNASADHARETAPLTAEEYLEEAVSRQISRRELETRIAIQMHYGAAVTLLRFSLDDLIAISGLTAEVCEAFLRRMSQPFGYRNPGFPDTFVDATKAPWDYNTVEERPFIAHGGYYWFFTNPMVASVLFQTFYFDLMADKAYRPTFEKSRGDFVELKVREYMLRIFPQHMVLSNPCYPNGEEFSDVAVLHDGKILIFQCKAKGLTRDARVGADFGKLRSDMQAAIRSAFDQAVRARVYIRSTDRPSLRMDGLTLNIDGEMITDIYLINVTMMPLLSFVSRFENIEEALGLFPEKEYPFSIGLGDLDIVTQILGTPAKFLHYINRRLALEKTPFGIHADELDLLGFYLSQGMYFDVADFAETNELYLNGFSDEIDEYVHRKYDLMEDSELPHAPTPDGFEDLLSSIEFLSNMYRTDCAIALLEMSGPSRAKIIEMVEKAKVATRNDGRGHSVSMGSPEHSRGFSFMTAVGENSVEAIYEQAASFAMLKKYTERCTQWFGLGWHRDSAKAIDVAMAFHFPWQKDEVMDDLTNRFLKPGTRIELKESSDSG